MAILKNGILGAAKGRISNLVTYTLNDQEIVRSIGVNTKAPTAKQLNNKMQMRTIMDFFSGMETLLQTGFYPKARGTTKNYHNLAIFYNKPNALKGFYPEVEIDYSKIIISAGVLPQPVNAIVEPGEAGLNFSWDVEGYTWPENEDQVMLMAYAPAKKEKVFISSGARRIEGRAVLEITPSMRNQVLEIYISFVSDDRQRVADSLYLGQIVCT